MIFTALDDLDNPLRRCWWAHRIARLTEREPDFHPVMLRDDATVWQVDGLSDWWLLFHRALQPVGYTYKIELKHLDTPPLEEMILPLLLYRFRNQRLTLHGD